MKKRKFRPLWPELIIAVVGVGLVAVVVGLLFGVETESELTIFSPALMWVVGAGVVMSSLVALVMGTTRKGQGGQLGS